MDEQTIGLHLEWIIGFIFIGTLMLFGIWS